MPGPGRTFKAAESEDQASDRRDRVWLDPQGICGGLIKKVAVKKTNTALPIDRSGNVKEMTKPPTTSDPKDSPCSHL